MLDQQKSGAILFCFQVLQLNGSSALRVLLEENETYKSNLAKKNL